jgi:hypothetical protein
MLHVALSCAIVIQAFLSASETTVAVTQASDPHGWLTICHGAESTTPSKDKTGIPQKLPCAMCALAAAASGLLPDLVCAAIPPRIEARQTQLPRSIAVISQAPARAGFSRAPPTLA